MENQTKILVVDDEYSFCKSLKRFLEKQGFFVTITTNGEHALDIIQEEKPNLMTLDIRMPGINGYEVLEQAKRLSHQLVIVVISAIDQPEMEDSLERVGANAVLHKPVDFGVVWVTINSLISLNSTRPSFEDQRIHHIHKAMNGEEALRQC